ncbi:MAG: hypothetical protein QOG01_3043 [Pseudonocardiales bacterium]|nr:hypothetical protein [Pseudonocardiales bacterium]
MRIRRTLSVLVGVAAVSFSLVVPSASATGASSATNAQSPTGSQFVEPYTDSPVTAAPPVSRPATAHCTVTLASHFLSNAPDGSPQTYSGTLTPPAQCPGPWAKVVMDKTITVSGRQYDRIDNLIVGGADIYRGTTEEPGGAKPITYTVSKDITAYSALLKSPQPFQGGIGNYVSSVYTGNYDQTVTITYYRSDRTHPAPDVADFVEGFAPQQVHSGGAPVHFALTGLPRNIVQASLQTTLEGEGCDEQWFDDVPSAVAAQYPDAGLCTGGPYREASVSLDGTPVGATHTFPHIYSGGLVPTLWRPIPAINTFDLRPESIDVTPFAGRLVDGATHDLAVTVKNADDTFDVIPTLFAWTDHHAAQTHGALTTDTVAVDAPETLTTSPTTGGTRVTDATSRHDVTAGWIDTSAGRITTQVVRTMAYRNVDTLTDGGVTQHVVQSDTGGQSVTSTSGGRVVSGSQHRYDYPLTIDFSAAQFTDDQNFSLTSSVDMMQGLADLVLHGMRWTIARASSEALSSTAVLTRVAGLNTESDGSSHSNYVGTDDQGRPYMHYLASNHGLITQDVQHP